MARDWCSQSEAARRLTAGADAIGQQELSRYLDRHREIPRKPGARGAMLVDFAALKLHREQNVRVREAKAAQNDDDGDESAALRLRERRAAAEKAEFELARARSELIPRSAVLRAVLAAGDALREAHRTTRYSRAEALEASEDARAKAALLGEQDLKVEQAFALALSALAGAYAGEDQDQGDVGTDSEAA